MTSPVRASRLSSTAPAALPSRRPATPGRADRPRRDARDRHLRIVAPASRRRRSGATVALAGTVVFASMIAAGLLHSQLVSGQIHLDRVERQIDLERTGLARDRLALASEQSPARIAEAATARGMVLSDGQHWLSPDAPPVDGDASPTRPGTSAPATEPSTSDERRRPPATDHQPTSRADERADAPGTGQSR